MNGKENISEERRKILLNSCVETLRERILNIDGDTLDLLWSGWKGFVIIYDPNGTDVGYIDFDPPIDYDGWQGYGGEY